MIKRTLMFSVTFLAVAMLGCDDGHNHAGQGHGGHSHVDGHGHDHDHAHGGHDHGHKPGDDDDDNGGRLLGTVILGDNTVEVLLLEEVKAGEEGHLDVTVTGDAPAAVRAWVGVADATGSIKALLEKESETGYHGHLELPDPLPDGSQLWIEVEDAGGQKQKGSFSFEPPAPAAP